ncbi:hypothetical protein TNCV_4176341 [Trichonephila clavipes]|nr:hypothetical protein TNCV_4176341 [Trichonephila clavipes]
MANLGHQSSPPTDLGRVDKEMASPGTAVRKVGGPPRKTTEMDDRYITLQAKRSLYQSASAIAQQLSN